MMSRHRVVHKSKTKWNCVDCGDNTQLEHYFVRNSVWFEEAGMEEEGMLCVGCLEARIGRRLEGSDFTDAHINDPRTHPMSMRLLSRLRPGR